MLRKWWQEIRAVGLRDWWWFVVYLKRDEFHENLRYCVLHRKYSKRGRTVLETGVLISKVRERAHELDIKLSKIG